eukprot:UN21484
MASSPVMMQSMCNNQINNNLGIYGSQFNQVNYGATQFDATFATPVVTPDFGAVMVNPQTLAMPAMNFSGVSPQMVPMAYPTIATPQMMPVMDISMSSVSPPPMAPLPSLITTGVPVMGYSMVPMPNGMAIMGIPQASGSLSPEGMGYILPEMNACSPPCSISRSCSPNSSLEEIPFAHEASNEEVSRDRLPSTTSSGSLDSNGMISKKELVENCLNEIDHIFGSRVQTAGMRGPTVMRIKVKTRPALEKIIDLLRALEQNCTITAISCPKSTKKGKQHIRGFLAYLQTSTVAEISRVQQVFDNFNASHMNGCDAPFKSLEVNPQKKNQN